MTARAMLIGTANPMPTLPPLGARMAVLIPISRPRRIDERARLELPGLIEASYWMDVLIALDAQTAAPKRADDAGSDCLTKAERLPIATT